MKKQNRHRLISRLSHLWQRCRQFHPQKAIVHSYQRIRHLIAHRLLHPLGRACRRTFLTPILTFIDQLQLGRIFRRLGLPFWTFMGVGIAGWWFDHAGVLLETLIKQVLQLESVGWQAYLPSLILFLVPFIVVLSIGLWFKHRYYKYPASQAPRHSILSKPTGKKGLILLVSHHIENAKFAINYHWCEQGSLEQVWLIHTHDLEFEQFGQGTKSKAEQIQQYCQELAQKHGKDLRVILHSTGISPADSQDTFDAVNRIFRNSQYQPDEIIADFTGGTKPMSVGMIMACLPAQRSLEYVSYNPVTNKSFGPYLIDYQHSAFDLIG